jgi:hypothetical protein
VAAGVVVAAIIKAAIVAEVVTSKEVGGYPIVLMKTRPS